MYDKNLDILQVYLHTECSVKLSCQDQGVRLTAAHLGLSSWNVGSSVPMEHWLTATQSENDRWRLHALGNVVIPQQASTALQCFSTLLEAARQSEG